MAKQVIEVLVPGGKATPGPPLGPALGPLGVPVPKVIAAINEKTKAYEGLTVPVKVIVDPATKSFEIEVGVPPTSALIKKYAKVEKGSGKPPEAVGNISLKDVIEIAKIKKEQSLGKSLKAVVKEVIGTCVSMGITVDGKNPKELIKEIDSMELPEE